MARLVRLFRTSIGKKLLSALSGLALLGFVTGHLAGNLMVFQGPETLNAYAAWLQGHPLLWVMRAGLIAIFALHVGVGIEVAHENRAARRHGYAHPETIRMGVAERHIVLSGVLVLAFVTFHLLHLTFGAIDPAGARAMIDSQGHPDVYARIVLGFRNPWITIGYLAAMAALWLHLQHAVRSLLQTLGFSHESYQALVETIAAALPGLLVAGLASIPLLALTGALPLAGETMP